MIFRRNKADLDLLETLFLCPCLFLGVSVYIGLFGWIFSVKCMLYEVCLPFDARWQFSTGPGDSFDS